MFKSLSNSTIGREHQQKPHDVLDGNDWSALADDFRTFLPVRDGSEPVFGQFTA